MTIVWQFLLPMGDTPDFSLRAPWLVSRLQLEGYEGIGELAWCMPFTRLQITNLYPHYCSPIIGGQSIFIIWSLAITSLTAAIVFTSKDFNALIKYVFLLLLPINVYMFQAFGEESIANSLLFLSGILFLEKRFLVSFILVAISFQFDIGQTYLYVLFILSLSIYSFARRFVSFRLLISVYAFTFLLGILSIDEIRVLLGDNFYYLKRIFENSISMGVLEKYSFIERMIILFLTFGLMLPSGFKPYLLIFGLSFLLIFYFLYAIKKLKSDSNFEIPFVAIMFICLVILVFPNYNHMKYFVVLTPFLIYLRGCSPSLVWLSLAWPVLFGMSVLVAVY